MLRQEPQSDLSLVLRLPWPPRHHYSLQSSDFTQPGFSQLLEAGLPPPPALRTPLTPISQDAHSPLPAPGPSPLPTITHISVDTCLSSRVAKSRHYNSRIFITSAPNEAGTQKMFTKRMIHLRLVYSFSRAKNWRTWSFRSQLPGHLQLLRFFRNSNHPAL